MYKNLNLVAIDIREATISEGLELAKKYGFEGFDPRIDELEQLAEDKSVDYVKELFSKAGVKPGAFTVPVNFRGDDAVYYENLSKLPARAKLAADIGLTRCYVVVGPASNDRPFIENFNFHVKRLRPLAEIVKDFGHIMGMEFIGPATSRAPAKFGFIHSMDAMLALAAAIGTGNVGLLLDVWHAYTAHATLEDYKKLSKEDIIYVHINDAPEGIEADDQIDSIRRLPGETGVIPLPEILNILKDLGYEGPVTPEPFSDKLKGITPDEGAKLAAEMTDKVWKEAGL